MKMIIAIFLLLMVIGYQHSHCQAYIFDQPKTEIESVILNEEFNQLEIIKFTKTFHNCLVIGCNIDYDYNYWKEIYGVEDGKIKLKKVLKATFKTKKDTTVVNKSYRVFEDKNQ